MTTATAAAHKGTKRADETNERNSSNSDTIPAATNKWTFLAHHNLFSLMRLGHYYTNFGNTYVALFFLSILIRIDHKLV